jgi:hypothetical protein
VQSLRDGAHNGLNTSDARRKEMRIDQKFHKHDPV